MTLRSSHNRTLKILKSAGIGGCLFVVAALFAFWPWPTEREDSSEEANLHSMHSAPGGSMDSSVRITADASTSNPQDTFSSKPDTPPASATPSSPSDDQEQLAMAKASPRTLQVPGPCKETRHEREISDRRGRESRAPRGITEKSANPRGCDSRTY